MQKRAYASESLTKPRRGLQPAYGRLVLMTDASRLPDPTDLLNRLPRGSWVIERTYGTADRRKRLIALIRQCRARGLKLLVAGDARLARAVRADGLHLPGWALKKRPGWRLWVRPDWIVSAAAHDAEEVFRAERLGVDVCLLSPVFATASHPDRNPLGLLRAAAFIRSAPLPVIVLGGIGPQRARRLKGIAHAGLAGIGDIVSCAALTPQRSILNKAGDGL